MDQDRVRDVMTGVSIWLAVLVLGGCSLSPAYHHQVMDLPASWNNTATVSLDDAWWQRFHDPVLNALVEDALARNQDIVAALARVEQAAAAARQSRAALAPVPSLDGSSTEYWTSSRVAGGPPVGYQRSSNVDLLAQATWELDIWGKFRNTLQGSSSRLRASEADLAAVRLLVAGTTVTRYFDLLSGAFRVRVARKTLEDRLQALDFYKQNVKMGFGSAADLLRARSEVESTRYSLSMATLEFEAAQGALLVLLGRSPDSVLNETIPASGTALAELATAPVLPDGLPSDLLLRRPDLRAAEQNLRAAHFDVGVVRADYFPSVSLTGQGGTAGQSLQDLGHESAITWNYGLALHLPLDFWKTRFRERMAETKCREIAAEYDKAMLNAFHDIRDALNRQSRLAEADRALTKQLDALHAAFAKARDRYEYGYSSFLEVLDADREIFSVQLLWAETRTQRLQAMVDLCMALGGGWGNATRDKASAISDTRGEGL